MLEALIRNLQRVNADVDAVALADALWLCGLMTTDGTDGSSPATAQRPALPAAVRDVGTPSPEGRREATNANPLEQERDVFDSPGTPGSRRALVGSAGRGPALPGALTVARALRPLKRPFPYGSEAALDTEATVRAYVETLDLTPVLAPLPERWFHLDLLVDQSASMQVWQDMVRELLALFQQLGAFRTVRWWGLDARTDVPVLYDSSGDSVRPDRLRDPHSRRLLVVFSDCIADGWHLPQAWQTLRSWAQSTATVLFNPLPPRLWPHTGLNGAIVPLTPTEPGTRAADLGYTVPGTLRMLSDMSLGQPGGWVPCPVTCISAASLDAWARTLMATDTGGCDGVLIPPSGRLTVPADDAHDGFEPVTDGPRPDSFPQASRAAQQLVHTFHHIASAPARRLAVLCSPQTELSLPLMRAVQETMEPDTGVTELAELVVSGLFEHVPGSEPAELRLRFRPGVREVLHESLAAEDAWQVRLSLARFTERNTARQPHPIAVAAEHGKIRVPDTLAPFTTLSERTLQRPDTASPADGQSREDRRTTLHEVFAGRYELIDPIGRGAVGAVWRAWDHRRRCYVAAKVLPQPDAHLLLRFVREQALRIDHPHVLAPTSWAVDDDQVLFTMELVTGGSLAHLVGDYGPLPPAFVCTLLDQLLSGLAAVHAKDVVHRDIKPANILLDATGTTRPHLYLSGFGVAMRLGEPRLTETNYMLSTSGYFAPEQMLGDEPDFPADLFAVGMVALYLLEGAKPDARALIEYFADKGMPGPPKGIPEPLWQVVATLLQPDPNARFRTATGARKALASATELLPEPGPDDELVEVFDQLRPLPDGFGPNGPFYR
ncbi:serine/threonine-protein kinase [Streptomyces sp. DSM 41602]|uniref:Serine/threonine-protein kinase n=1 Tax=Streptomyces antimycoticus TaxID=68175 RepID=A0ABD5JMP3_9ACTN|nr:serine/threonine-protein kinase [Streptomyces violaceusniger]MEE4589144.1 serine/threonine-protein kinase [Streptomyces sp. DSM 41602]